MPGKAAIDTNVLVALVDSRDKWHGSAETLREALKAKDVDLVYFDSIVNAVVSVLARRAHEQGRSHRFQDLLDAFVSQVPTETITWLSAETKRLFEQVIALVRNTSGALNFHDALIALGCRELGVEVFAGFDQDFDRVTWLTRVDTPNSVTAAFASK